MAYGVADRTYHVEGCLDVEVGAWQDGPVVSGAGASVLAGDLAPEVDAADHASSVRTAPTRCRACQRTDPSKPIRCERARAVADLPVEHGDVSGCPGAAARLRGPLSSARAPPTDDLRQVPPAFRHRRDPRGLRGRAARRAVRAPSRLSGADDLCGALRGRPIRH